VLSLIEVNEQNPVAEGPVWLTMALAIPQRAVEKVILSTVGTLFITVDTLFFTVPTLFVMPAGEIRPPPLTKSM
jgi:hypothetical protein